MGVYIELYNLYIYFGVCVYIKLYLSLSLCIYIISMCVYLAICVHVRYCQTSVVREGVEVVMVDCTFSLPGKHFMTWSKTKSVIQ